MPNTTASAEIHSVILNLNKNFSNNNGSNFQQIVNKQLELKPNTLVALYAGNIVRKPVVIEEDTLLDIEFPSQFPTAQQLTMPEDATDITSISADLIDVVSASIPSGYYSKTSFARTLCGVFNATLESNVFQEIDTLITPESGGNTMHIHYPYRVYFEAKDDNVYLGLRRVELDQQPSSVDERGNFSVDVEDLDNGQRHTSNLTVATDNERFIFQSSFRTNNWDSFAIGNNPILPHCYSHLTDEGVNPVDAGWANVNINIDPVAASNEVLEFCYTFNNTYFNSHWNSDAAPAPPTEKQLVDVNEKPSVVSCLIGAYLQVNIAAGAVNGQKLTFYCNENLSDITKDTYNSTTANINSVMNANMRSLMTVDLDKYDFSDVLSGIWCEVYAVDVPTRDAMQNAPIEEDDYDYYFRWYIRSPYSNFNELTLLFDSKNVGLRLPQQVVDSAYLFHSLQSDNIVGKQQSGGLCPQFYFKNCFTDLKVSQPTINSNIQYDNVIEQWKYLAGIRGYNFQPTTDESTSGVPIVGDNTRNNASLQNVLGVADNNTTGTFSVNEQTLYNPSKFPSNKMMAGLTQLNSDDQRYNIEVNLPVKAYNTTEQTRNDIGQTRTIIYNTNASLGKDDNPTVGLINKELQPPTLKYLSLNNPEPIKLNTLDINIRRAKTNAIADEITDSSIELLFYSEGNPHGKPPTGSKY